MKTKDLFLIQSHILTYNIPIDILYHLTKTADYTVYMGKEIFYIKDFLQTDKLI